MKKPSIEVRKARAILGTLLACGLASCAGTGTAPVSPLLRTPTRVTVFAVSPQAPNYDVVELPGLGGTFALAGSVNESGLVAGLSTLPGDAVVHAVVWRGSHVTDLGTLGGPNSGQFGLNNHGVVSGNAETPDTAPFGEDYCQDGSFHTCVPVLWRDGNIIQLPTLGGANATPLFGMNDRGMVPGVAETAIPDATCPSPQKHASVPVVWGPEPNEVRRMPMFPGDTNGQAQSVNERGTVVGESGVCSNIFPNGMWGSHALLWRDGKAIDLGNLGGTTGITTFNVNNRDQIVGQSDVAGDAAFHAFLWQDGVMTDLGTLPGDVSSRAWWITDGGQITGVSIDASHFPRAFLIQKHTMYDLSALVPSNSNLLLLVGFAMNNSGDIVGDAIDTNTGNIVAYLAMPSHGNAASATRQAFSRTVSVPAAAVAKLRRFEKWSRM